MPGGAEFYNFAIEYYTGRARDPKVVHQTGLDEVARIQSQMREIALSVTGNDDLPTFVDYLAKLPEQHPESREAIVAFNQGLVEKAERELPKYFERLPGHKCTVTPIEKFREADSPAGYYDRAPEDHSQPAKYYVNAHNPTERLYYNMEALAFHEAVPGHHLQIALAQELTDLPDFRRHLGETAYTEGWALYTERLSDEMGLYSGPIGRFGMLNFQAWRAARLVIDTGLHAMGWTRGQSIDYLKEITGFDSQHAAIEIDRYIVMPGQALAYMLGRLEIDAMRKKAETTLGSAFNLKKFHSQILDQGALPLASVGRLLDTWLDEQTQSMSS